MPDPARSLLALQLVITVEDVATLTIDQHPSTVRRDHIRFFLRCHAPLKDVLAAARAFAAEHGGDALEVKGAPELPPMVTVGLPLNEVPIIEYITSMASGLIEAVSARIPET